MVHFTYPTSLTLCMILHLCMQAGSSLYMFLILLSSIPNQKFGGQEIPSGGSRRSVPPQITPLIPSSPNANFVLDLKISRH